MDSIQNILSKNIKKYREKLDLSQFKLASESGLSQGYINSIESGMKYPSASSLEKICSVLNIKPYVLFLDDKDTEKFEKLKVLNEIRDKTISIITEKINKTIDEYL